MLYRLNLQSLEHSLQVGGAIEHLQWCISLREEESLVDMFVIEMLVVLIHSLKMAHRDEKSLGNMPSCLTSLLFDYT